MKKNILVLILFLPLIHIQAQTELTIYEIQGQTAVSPYNNQNVSTHGIVTASFSDYYFLQDGAGAWNGIVIYDPDHEAAEGDSVTITGLVEEYFSLTEIKDISEYTLHSSNASLPEPVLLPTGEVADEQYEGVLVMVDSAMCTASDLGYGEWQVDDGSGAIRVDDLGYAYSPILVELYDVIGPVMYSFDNYKIEPRDLNDVYFTGYPLYFTSFPEQSNLSENGFTINWKTNLPSTTEIEYGLTPDFELGKLMEEDTALHHSISFTTLEAGNIYYLNIFSMVSGTDIITKEYVHPYATVSNSSGEIKVYFNNYTDSTVATGEYAVNTYLKTADTLISYIQKAQETLDVMVYNNNMGIIVDAINEAYERGVQVRYIADEQSANTALSDLHQDIPMIESSSTGIMHNKVLIIDAESVDNSWILTGSTNFTSNNLYTDFNNIVCIQDQSLAKAYTLEFNEMWGSDSETPDAGISRFGYDKLDDTPHQFMIGGKKVELFFSPSDQPTHRILEVLESADSEIYFALLSFTKDELGQMIIEKNDAGLDVKGIIENVDDAGGEYTNLLNAGVDVWHHNQTHDIHHKYAIVDAQTPDSDPIVLTGSHNWSSAAESRNDENTLIIHDATIANLFYQEFSQRYKDLTEISVFEGMDPGEFEVYPNPSSSYITVQMNSENSFNVRILDISGKTVLVKFNQMNKNNIYVGDLEPGLYLMQINQQVQKLIIE